MEQYQIHIKQIRQHFLDRHRNGFWNHIVDEANQCVAAGNNYMFHDDCHPHFYSGKLFDQKTLEFIGHNKLFFITLNPKFGKHVSSETEIREGYGADWKQDIGFQNNTFIPRPKMRGFPMFDKCNTFLRHVLQSYPKKDVPKYNSLNTKGVVFDWIPFYSDNFSLRLVNTLLREYLEKIIIPLSEVKSCIVAGGPKFKSAFEENLLDVKLKMDNVTTKMKVRFPGIKQLNLSVYKKKGCYLILWSQFTGYPSKEDVGAVAEMVRTIYPNVLVG